MVILLLLVSCNSPEQVKQNNEVISEYNHYVEVEQQIVADHNKILEHLRFKMGDKFSYRSSIDEYLAFVGKYKQDIVSFKDFLTAHEQFLDSEDVNVDFTRNDLQNIIDTMDKNAKDFREWKVNNPITT